MQVLTHGLIANQFAQIFLISHSPSVDARSFRYSLRMRDGAVEETTLPSPREAARQWEGEPVPASAAASMLIPDFPEISYGYPLFTPASCRLWARL